MKSGNLAALILLGFLLPWSGVAFGQADVPLHNSTRQTVITTSELSEAKAYTNPLLPPDTSRAVAETASSAAGRLVSGWSRGGGAAASTGSPGTRAYGTFGIPYSSGRVQLGKTNQDFYDVGRSSFLTTTYPYRTAGKLTFSAGYCSASVILPGIIVTAAHCIQSFGSGAGGLFSNWQFTPASDTRSGSRVPAPYGTWTWRTLVRPGSWSDGTDIGCGAARDNDLAVIALNKNGSNRLIGQLTGWLGYGWNNYSFVSDAKTGNLLVAATTTLGYPALFDSGRIMQQARGPSYLTTVCSAGQIWQGSNFTGGSSGGPWVVNFRASNPVYSGGASAGTASGRSVVIGVTSWGSADPNTPKDNYSSQFRQNTRYPDADYGGHGAGNIGSLLETLCNAAANDGSGQTLGQRGWC